jgi:agmatinase
MVFRAVDELVRFLRPAGGGLFLVSSGKDQQTALQRRFYDAQTDDDITHKFHATLKQLETARVVVLGIPSDVGAGFRRGANLGPQAIREQLVAENPGLLHDWASRGIVDIGDVVVVPQLLHDEMLSDRQLSASREALYPDVSLAERSQLPAAPLSIAEHVLNRVLQLNPRVKPFILGGDHSCAWPVVSALHAAGRKFCIVQPDAHTDLLAERLGIRICFATWTFHANELIGRQGRVIQVGIRASRRPREHWESTLGVKQFWAEDVRADPEASLDAIVLAVQATGLPLYFSNDIDGTDAEDADATGTPEPDGLEVTWLCRLIQRLGTEVGLVGADLVEVAPLLGRDGGRRTLEVAALYSRETLNALLT